MENKRKGRKSETIKMSDAMTDLLKSYRIEEKFYETQLVDEWERIMGAPIASRTSKIYIREKALIVHVSSAPLRHELEMSKDRILELLEKEMGRKVVEKVVFR